MRGLDHFSPIHDEHTRSYVEPQSPHRYADARDSSDLRGSNPFADYGTDRNDDAHTHRAFLADADAARRALQAALARRIPEADDARPLVLVLFDLDGFKQVNDSFGHDAGDALLRGVARRLLRVTRRSDTVARLSGDEFALLLYPIADAAVLEQVAQRIFAALSLPIRHRGRALRAVADDHQAAQSVGIPLNQIWLIVWSTAGIVALVAGMAWGSKLGVQFSLSLIALKALPVLILGGLTSIPGAIVGGLVVGAGEKLAELYIGPYIGGGIEYWFAYVLALAVLLVRPQGLFGEKIIERV